MLYGEVQFVSIFTAFMNLMLIYKYRLLLIVHNTLVNVNLFDLKCYKYIRKCRN